MSDARAVAGMDRLPWLADELPPKAKSGRMELAGWAVGAAVLLAGASYWMGANNSDEPLAPVHGPRPAATVELPQARPASPPQVQPQVKIETARQVEPIVAPPMPVVDEPPRLRRVPASTAPKLDPVVAIPVPPEPTPVASPPPPAVQRPLKADPLQPWPARVVDGAAGRLIRIGAFSTPRQAKKGWWAIMRINPALQRLPALVVAVQSLRNGRIYYRLQMGTTSQAHSEILCQRLRMIGQSCVVIGLSAEVGR